MKRLRYIRVEFADEIRSWEIPAFRGAIIDKVGRENMLFHNHLGDQFHYRYPLIQYKTIKGKPALLCMEHGADEIHKFFEKSEWNIRLSEREVNMKVERLDMQQFNMQVWDKMFHYRIRNWIALNQKNYSAFQGLESLAERIHFLEKVLIGNILSFAKGIEWRLDKEVKVQITSMGDSKPVKLKGISMDGYQLDFKTNVFLPEYVGMGKGASLGYGIVNKKRKEDA